MAHVIMCSENNSFSELQKKRGVFVLRLLSLACTRRSHPIKRSHWSVFEFLARDFLKYLVQITERLIVH